MRRSGVRVSISAPVNTRVLRDNLRPFFLESDYKVTIRNKKREREKNTRPYLSPQMLLVLFGPLGKQPLVKAVPKDSPIFTYLYRREVL
jgi:hypothetical protein